MKERSGSGMALAALRKQSDDRLTEVRSARYHEDDIQLSRRGDTVQVAKWGNSLAVRLPKSLVIRLGLKPGDRLAVVDADSARLVIEKTGERAAALERMAARGWTTPGGWRFDRDEANAR